MNIIELAKEANIPCFAEMYVVTQPAELERFADLVRAEAYKNWNPDVTFNEDGTFSLELPDGDELRIIPPKREWVDLTDEDIATVVHEMNGNEPTSPFWRDLIYEAIASFKEKQK